MVVRSHRSFVLAVSRGATMSKRRGFYLHLQFLPHLVPALDFDSCARYIVTQVKDMKQTLTIRIPDELRRELEKISESEAKPLSDLVRESLQRYISIYRFRRLRKRVLPFAEAQGLLTDEDVFRSIS